MLLTINNTKLPATDLGYLLHKNPNRTQSFPTSFGEVHVAYPEAEEHSCTVALILDIDPIQLVRKTSANSQKPLHQYVNDRPYVASSFLSVALAKVFGSALQGNCKARPDLVQQPLPLTIKISVLPCDKGEEFLKKLFQPLNYSISIKAIQLDEKFSDWGNSKYYSLELQATKCLSEVLSHLYVLVPVLDNEKHYWVGEEEVKKLLKHGEAWLSEHPEKKRITERYLKYQRNLTRDALEQLTSEDPLFLEQREENQALEESILEEKLSLNQQRMQSVCTVLKESGAKSIADLGCGDGKLLQLLLQEKQFEKIIGMDVSYRALEICRRRLRVEDFSMRQKERLHLMQGSLIYHDKRLLGLDGVAVIEVIEHLDLHRLSIFERILFKFAQPKIILVTTPNQEYNIHFERLPAGKFRHQDHRFEWTRDEFQSWANKVAQENTYQVRFVAIGDEDPKVGAPTQMGVFEK